jgi:hypothetical protein
MLIHQELQNFGPETKFEFSSLLESAEEKRVQTFVTWLKLKKLQSKVTAQRVWQAIGDPMKLRLK